MNMVEKETEESDAENSTSNLINIAGEVRTNEPSSNLVTIASAILGQATTNSSANLINIADEIRENEKQTANLVNIADTIINKSFHSSDQPEEELASYIKYRNSIRDLINKNGVSEQTKLNIISVLTHALVDSRIDPQFSISWLLLYSNALHNLNAEENLRAIFNRWLWASISDLKNNPQELSKIPSPVMIQLAKDVTKNNHVESKKVIEEFRHYICLFWNKRNN